MKRQQNGFGLVGLLIVAGAVAIVGFVAWRAYSASQVAQKEQASAASVPQAKPVDPNAGYFVIKEWNVRFKPTSDLSGIQYFVPKGLTKPGVDGLTITTEQLTQKEPNCGRDTAMSIPLGAITRTKDANPPAENGGVIAEIAGYKYQYRGSDASCSENAANLPLESQVRSATIASLKTLEAAR